MPRRREHRHAKAHRLLATGQLTVTHVGPELVEATCVGDTATYDVGYKPGAGWFCTCPAWGHDCSHLIACVLVTVPTPSRTGTQAAPQTENTPRVPIRPVAS